MSHAELQKIKTELLLQRTAVQTQLFPFNAHTFHSVQDLTRLSFSLTMSGHFSGFKYLYWYDSTYPQLCFILKLFTMILPDS